MFTAAPLLAALPVNEQSVTLMLLRLMYSAPPFSESAVPHLVKLLLEMELISERIISTGKSFSVKFRLVIVAIFELCISRGGCEKPDKVTLLKLLICELTITQLLER